MELLQEQKMIALIDAKPECKLVEVKKLPRFFRKSDAEELNQLGYPNSILRDSLFGNNFSERGKERAKFLTLHRQTCARCRDEWEAMKKKFEPERR